MIYFFKEILRKKNISRIFAFIFLIINVLLLVYIFVLGYHNPILIDDYCFLKFQKTHGIFGSLKWWYINWQGRFMPQLFTNIFVWIYQIFESTILLTVLYFVVFVLGINRIFKNLNFKVCDDNWIDKLYTKSLKLLLFNAIVLFNFEPSTFFWINVSTMYFGGIFFLILGISELFYNSKKLISYFILCFSFFYVGCSSEHVGLITLVLLATAIVIKKTLFLKKIVYSKLILAIVVCSISFLIMVMAPGNEVRRSHFPEPSFLEAFIIAKNSLIKVVKLILPKMVDYIMVGFPFLLLGILNRKQADYTKLFKIVILAIPLVLIMLYVFMLPTAYAISALGPKRSLTYVTGVLIVLTIILAYLFGLYSRLPVNFGVFLAFLSGIYLSGLAYNSYNNVLPDSIAFSKSEKQRVDRLLMLKEEGNKELVEIIKRTNRNNNIFINHEISENPDNWHNECICNSLSLGYKIKLGN